MSGGVNVHYGANNINVGPLKEIPQICVDHFFGNDLKSTAFFLSHAHTDHMVGLESASFLKRLNEPGIYLYTQDLTPILMETFARYLGGPEGIRDLILRRKLIPKITLQPFIIEVPSKPDNFYVTVTLLPAGHCPGSVMFLFETESLRVLHTGDFRVTLNDLKSLSPLHTLDLHNQWQPKRIDHLYVDTTFCYKSANLFPCRKEVTQRAIGYVKQWRAAAETNWVYIQFPAKFAHEYILIALYETFKMKIHVSPERKAIYKKIPTLDKVVTLDSETPFHLCGDRNCRSEFGTSMEMRLTSMWYTISEQSLNPMFRTSKEISKAKEGFSNFQERQKPDVIRTDKRLSVCYSMHSSLQEIARTIDYLQPAIVTPLVRPFKGDMEDLKVALRDACSARFTFEDYKSNNFEILNYNKDPNEFIEMDGMSIFDVKKAKSDDEDKPFNFKGFKGEDLSPHCSSAFLNYKPTVYAERYRWKACTPSPEKNKSNQSTPSNSQEGQQGGDLKDRSASRKRSPEKPLYSESLEFKLRSKLMKMSSSSSESELDSSFKSSQSDDEADNKLDKKIAEAADSDDVVILSDQKQDKQDNDQDSNASCSQKSLSMLSEFF